LIDVRFDQSVSGAASRLEILNNQSRNLKKEQKKMSDQWETEKQHMSRLQKIKEEVDRVNIEIQQAEREYNLSRFIPQISHRLTSDMVDPGQPSSSMER